MQKQDLSLNNQPHLICHKTKPNNYMILSISIYHRVDLGVITMKEREKEIKC